MPSVEAALAYAEGFQAALKQVENSKVAQLIEQVNALKAQLAFERAQVPTLKRGGFTRIDVVCQFEDCEQPAKAIACGRNRHPNPGCYCEAHANAVVDEDDPEYGTRCPNCGCLFGHG